MTVSIERESELQAILSNLPIDSGDDLEPAINLVEILRPAAANNTAEAAENLKILIHLLKNHPIYCQGLRNYLLNIFSSKSSMRAFTELGIHSSAGFFTETIRKATYKFLPPAYTEDRLMYVMHRIFYKMDDFIWVNAIKTELWGNLFQILNYTEPHLLKAGHPNLNQLLNCILILSQRITAIGLEPEIVEKLPEIELFHSPFMVQSREISVYIEKFNDPVFERTTADNDYKHIIVMLNQCEEYIALIRKNKNKFGTSLHLTHLLLRAVQNIERLRMFLKLVHFTKEQFPFEDEAVFFKLLIRAENKKYSLREHFSNNLQYLAFQITEHTGKKGDKYITSTRKEYGKMLKSAMGGGFIVGFLTIIKAVIYRQSLSLFGRAFLFSMNYSLGFILIHVTHSTLATKQPAMTASRFASTLDIKGSKSHSIANLVEMIVRLARSQFIAFIGNIIIAFPIGLGLAWLIGEVSGNPFVYEEFAVKTIKEIHPWKSLALFHAAIAGVFLFLSGLISGYYDNLNVYRKIPERIRQHQKLREWMGAENLMKFANYIEQHLGALAGNFFLGILLGTMGTVGIILGLPLDIRHVTFASGNFGLAFASLDFQLPDYTIIITCFGIALIGLVNFIVSFGLTIIMAMKSRNVTFRETRELFQMLWTRFLFTPLDFFWAPRQRNEQIITKDDKNISPLKDLDK